MVDTSTNSWKLLYEAGRQALQDRKLHEAEQSFSAALQLAEDFAPGDPRLSATLNALARIYSLQRRYLAAAALLNRLLEVTERTLGPNHVQVAGVLTNLAEMYTHLGAAREELDLRERALAIRADDTAADATSLQRLRERVTELRAMLAAEAAPEDDEELEPLPTVRTEEYISPIPRPAHPEASASGSIATVPASSVSATERDDAYRLSPSKPQMSVAPWPGAAATDATPTSALTIEIEHAPANVEDVRPSLSASGVELISVSETSVLSYSGATDHGFSDMGRDELLTPMKHRVGGRSAIISIASIAAGVVLVAGILAARSFVATPEDERVSQGSVNLANAPAVVVLPVAAPAASDPKTGGRLVPERAERTATRGGSDESPRPTWVDETREVIKERRPVRIPTAADMERTLKGLDGAVKAIDQRAKAAADSLTTIRVQAPTFKKVKIADP